MTPQQFDAMLHRKMVAFVREVASAEEQTAAEVQSLFVKQSSGTLSTKRLRLMGHPYAARAPQAVDPSIVNAQSGELRRSWKKLNPSAMAGKIVTSVVSTDPKSKYMFGTSRMVVRPIDKFVADTIAPRRLRRIQSAIARAFRA